MSNTPDQPTDFWDLVWRCREELDRSAAAHRVPFAAFSVSSVFSVGSPSFSKTESDSEAEARTFLQDAQFSQSWRWQRVLVFCSYVLELLLALRFEEAKVFVEGLLAQKTLWTALQRDETQRHRHLLTTLNFFATIPSLRLNWSRRLLTLDDPLCDNRSPALD